ncbi:MAG: TIGR00730 family Rossman fold protein [Bacteroidaceae bacterium]|nr:TIGR00730 family Rossman fold protein [Bacteroidaceae bacterium]
MAKEKSVAVFCAASENISPGYFEAVAEVGAMLGRMGAALVYGGARFGLMEATARAAKNAGARIVGVVPDILVERDRVSTLLDEKIPCRNLSERKDIMLAKSDILVALPGGIGTLDEIFHVMAAATIGYHKKRVVLYNVNGFWDPLTDMLDRFNDDGFIRGNVPCFMPVANSIGELETLINEAINE